MTSTAVRGRSAPEYDLAVVGAGFAGLACARSAALRGLSVLVLDRQARAGQVIHTTGLLVKEAAERWEVPARLTQRIRGVRLYAPTLSYIDLAAPGYYFLATNTAALMQWLAEEARRAGARLRYDCPFRGASRDAGAMVLAGSVRASAIWSGRTARIPASRAPSACRAIAPSCSASKPNTRV